MDKLSERIDEIQMMLSQALGKPDVQCYKKRLEGAKLNVREQEVFIVLYTSEGEVVYKDVARRLGLTFELVEKYVKSLVEKGVPIIRTFANNDIYLSLDQNFKDIQAKESIIEISEEISAIII